MVLDLIIKVTAMKSAGKLLVWCILGLNASSAAPSSSDSVYAPLRLYDGSWHITRKDLPAGAKPDELKNQCALVGKFFACQQTVNGEVSALLIFIPTDKPGHYVTQNVNSQGRALGGGNLEISGNRWVFSSRWDQGGKTTYYQTINVFNGRDHIHFEQQESSNGKDWTVKNSGDETRVAVGR
jgi:hypothetical protein